MTETEDVTFGCVKPILVVFVYLRNDVLRQYQREIEENIKTEKRFGIHLMRLGL